VSENKLIVVPVTDLVLNDAYQVRDGLDKSAVRRYADAMKSGQEFPPITVSLVNGVPVVVDGWHRTTAAKQIGRATLPAHLIEADEKELAWLGVEANRAHGVPLKRSEARSIFKAYVRAGRHKKSKNRVKSSREIAEDLHGMKSHATILEWMRQDFPSVYRQMSRGEDEPRFEGGLHEVKPEERFYEAAETALATLMANIRGVKDPAKRGQIIADLEKALQEIKQDKPWEPVPVDDDLF
jgi:Predicted transcriptional regulators